jgi:selenocysteine-specific elongation factor
VRGLQSHRARVERALHGTRTAVNLSGLAVEDLARGEVLTTPGWLTPTRLIDAQLRLIADAPLALEQNDEVGFFTGSSETLARVTLLNNQRIEPGDESWVQFRFPLPIAVVKGDRFIIRQPSPSLTIGGGVVIDPHPKRHRRFRSDVIDSLEVLAAGTPAEIVAQAIGAQPVELRGLSSSVALPDADVRSALDELIANGDVLLLRRAGGDGPLTPTSILMRADAFEALIRQLRNTLGAFHERQPLRRGMAKEEVRSRSGIAARMFEEILARGAGNQEIAVEGDILRLPEHEIRFTPDQRQRIDRYLTALRANPHTPPPPSEFGIEPELAIALAETGEVVRVDDNIVFARETFDEIQREVLEIIAREQRIT